MKKVSAILDNSIKIMYATDERIMFNDGSYICFNHDADCCEHNYADFSSIKDSVIDGVDLYTIELEYNGYGFLLNGHLVNCYSDQNGYYSYALDVYYKDRWDNTILCLDTQCADTDF